MKKTIALILACIFLTAVLPAAAEDAGNPAAGEWYADLDGAAVILTLSPDGTYILSAPALSEMNQAGAWEFRDGYVYMDGDEAFPLSFSGSTLTQEDSGLFFTREQPETYVPGEIMPDAPAGLFAGLWRSAWILRNGSPVPAGLAEDDTLIYVEGTKAILKGGPFGYRIADFTLENGALACEEDGAAILLQIQEDGFLRLTVSGGGADEQVLYLVSAGSGDGEEMAEE